MTSSSPRLLLLVIALVSHPAAGDSSGAPSTTYATEDEKAPHASLELCVSEHERGRLFRNELRLIESRAALARCAEADCPLAIRADCASWLSELETLVPSVVLVIEGSESSGAVRLFVDGQLLARRLDEPLELTPGLHRLRLELPPHAPIERDVVLAPGEKNRIVRVRFVSERRDQLMREAPAAASTSRPVPAATYWLGTGALLWATTSAILAGSAIVDESRANEQCAPRCPPDVRQSIERRLLFADIAGGLALGLAGFAVHSYFTRPTVTTLVPDGPRFSLDASQRGAAVLWGGKF